MVPLLKTARPKLPRWRTKSKHYFSPYVRLCDGDRGHTLELCYVCPKTHAKLASYLTSPSRRKSSSCQPASPIMARSVPIGNESFKPWEATTTRRPSVWPEHRPA